MGIRQWRKYPTKRLIGEYGYGCTGLEIDETVSKWYLGKVRDLEAMRWIGNLYE